MFRNRLSLCVASVVLACAAPALAQSPSVTATELRRTLAGEWRGALSYRDYQSDRVYEIPVHTVIEPLDDGNTIIKRSLFDDGPDKPVWITSVSLDDRDAKTVTTASFRQGRPVEPMTEAMAIVDYRDRTHWTIAYTTTAADGDGPAEIRVSETRDGDTLTQTKDVRPVGGAEDAWSRRNQTTLKRDCVD